MDIRTIFRKLFSKKDSQVPFEDVTVLRRIFKQRYQSFKLLLNANNRALELMSEIDETLKGDIPFGMTSLRSLATRVSTNCYQVIRQLDNLAPEKYEALYQVFKQISERIQGLTSATLQLPEGPIGLSLEQIDSRLAPLVGTKVANLGELRNHLHIPVPEGFALTVRAYEEFMYANDLPSEIDRVLQSTEISSQEQFYTLCASIQQMIIRASIPDSLRASIHKHAVRLEEKQGSMVRLAVRSSALGEDSAGRSFAGQYRSELNVSPENIGQAYKEVVASKYSLTAMTYRWKRGIPDEYCPMSVGFLEMIQGVCGGVIYTRNPVTNNSKFLVINAVWGLPKAVVDGRALADEFFISRTDPPVVQQRSIAQKTTQIVCYPDEGIYTDQIPEEAVQRPVLEDSEAIELAALALKIEAHYGHPQDIEWTKDTKGTFFILQCRPLQTKQEISIPDRVENHREDPDLVEALLYQGGITASSGVASGFVYKVSKESDILSFPEEAVLVTAQALPRWAILLHKAAAIITEQGNIVGHLANVARELDLPALFGVTGALEFLTQGQEITLDSDHKEIYSGRREFSHGPLPQRPSLLNGSPVQETLQKLRQVIVPLTLLDPKAPEFRPEKCKTLHDLTRFCHEKSLEEMFRFGKDHRFPERSSKQLVCDVPMQFWVLNLDDGFTEEVSNTLVSIDNIASIPMLALWQGMIAIPWKGPPPVDARGFMSVLMEATVNPGLDPSIRSCYDIRNYFMISKYFCSLQSRFGFHFSTVETLVTDRPLENYISFQFKGGAADVSRKIRRAQLVAQILEQFGFQTEVKEDAAFARMENFEQSVMEDALRVLGYITIHTRQLDMVMGTDHSMEEHRRNILSDLQKIIEKG